MPQWHRWSQRQWSHSVRKTSSLGCLDVMPQSKQRPLGRVIHFMWSEVGGLVLLLLVHGNLYIAIYVHGETSPITLPTPSSALPDTCVQELGDVAAKAGRSLRASATAGRIDP